MAGTARRHARSAARDRERPSPELLPLHALSVHPLPDQHLANLLDGLAPATDVDDQPIHAVNETLDRVRRVALLTPPVCARLADGRKVREGRIATCERTKVSVIEQMSGLSSPEDQPVGTAITSFVEMGEDGVNRHDADLLGDEERPARIGAVEHEAAVRPLER